MKLNAMQSAAQGAVFAVLGKAESAMTVTEVAKRLTAPRFKKIGKTVARQLTQNTLDRLVRAGSVTVGYRSKKTGRLVNTYRKAKKA